MSTTRRFTLIEVVIASIVFLIVIGAAMGLLTRTDKTIGASLKITDVVLRADRLANRVHEELSQAVSLNLNLTNSTVPGNTALNTNWTTVTYQKIVAVNPTTGLPSTTVNRQLRFRYEEAPDLAASPAGTGNDTDDDNDGLIDEGVVELWEGGNLVAVLGRDIASAAEVYEPGSAPWIIYPSSSGTRGGAFAFQFSGAGNETQANGTNMRGLTFRFFMMARLPVLVTKGGAQVPSFHHESRTVRVAFRSTGGT